MPTIYFQLKLIRKFWTKSSDPEKQQMIKLLTSEIEKLEQEYFETV